ncbi:MAG: (E)-4-hydroxy-3-methylbut-2-enyl-diphosphate synthase [Prevotellaceae bacterium]|nr:(E)-4-hydroxy-3-methylbut-2-enyl-diphosphate synthase [Prevotellaceae bacterium]
MIENIPSNAGGPVPYCINLFEYRRRSTCDVRVGSLVIGSAHPIRIQTMVTTPTADVKATVEQCIRVAEAGAELVRVTAPAIRDAQALKQIHSQLRAAGYNIPLVADVHFNPSVAEVAARYVEKVRINPGNYTDKQARLSTTEFSADDWARDLQRLRTQFLSLLDVCRQHGAALRIGVNHGSLSSRIMTRYGDTPAGMVESAMEFLRICSDENFNNVLVSMKASNTLVMVHAYRLLCAAMNSEGMSYPLHLGVTEAGDAEDGRTKSAVGIGTLLSDGIGDTIRVSLTEDPVNEIPVARSIVNYFDALTNHHRIEPTDTSVYNPFEPTPRSSSPVLNLGGGRPVATVSDLSTDGILTSDIKKSAERISSDEQSDTKLGEPSADLRYYNKKAGLIPSDDPQAFSEDDPRFIFCNYRLLTDELAQVIRQNNNKIIVLDAENTNGTAEQRAFFLKFASFGLHNPVIIRREYDENDFEQLLLKASCDFGALLIDGFGDAIMISNRNASIPPERILSASFGILQAARVRRTRTEYIACPGCGRTLFDLRETLSKVKQATTELKGLRIAVMGCIVNGPGEMADADFGYVGAGAGRVTLYRGREAVKKNIPQENAIQELLAIIADENKSSEAN